MSIDEQYDEQKYQERVKKRAREILDTFEEMEKERQEDALKRRLKKLQPFIFGTRFLSALLLFHEPLGWETLPWLLNLWLTFFIGANITLTIILAICCILLFFIIQKPEVYSSGVFKREQFGPLEENGILRCPFDHFVVVPMIMIGIRAFGYPVLSLVYCAAYVLERIAQHQFACLMTKFDVEE